MSERMTGIELPGVNGSGWQEYGRVEVADMIAAMRKRARAEKAVWDAVLSAADEDFRITTYKGPWAQRNREVIQDGRSSSKAQGSPS